MGTPRLDLGSGVDGGGRPNHVVAGCTGYVEKPINPGTFMVEIEKYS